MFSKRAIVWGSADWKEELTLEENVNRSLKRLLEGLNNGKQIKLDGFLFEVSNFHSKFLYFSTN